MMRNFLAFALLSALLSGCSTASDAERSATSASDVTASTVATSDSTETSPTTAMATELAVISGDFVIANTTEGGGDVGVESIDIAVEVDSGTGAWSRVAGDCVTEPATPLVVTDRQTVEFECELVDALPPAGAVRAVIVADVFGTDDDFRQEVVIRP